MKRILHIVNDGKFIKEADIVFNSLDSIDNYYLVIGKNNVSSKLDSLKLLFLKEWELLFPTIVNEKFKKFDAIFVHCMTPSKLHFVRNFKKKIPITWIGWGDDYYTFLNTSKVDYLLPKTYKMYEISEVKSKRNFKSKLYNRIIKNRSLEKKINILSRISFLNTVIKDDYDILRLILGRKVPKYIDWNYPVLSDSILLNESILKAEKTNIIIGNSYQPSNNHIDAFDTIKLADRLNFHKIICPLSYGSSYQYRNRVVDYGQLVFGDKFEPLLEFIPYDDYVEKLKTCKYFYLPTVRQQGLGNVILMLYLGSIIILEKNNPMYAFFIKNKVKVFTMEEINSNIEFDQSDIINNRNFVIENYSFNSIRKKTIDMFKQLDIV